MAWRLKARSWALARSLAAAFALCGASLICVPGIVLAATPDTNYQERLDNTVRYLQSVQNSDGGFGGEAGGGSTTSFSAWAALALAAAGINPQDQAREGGTSVYSYLTDHASELTSSLELARELLVVDASGTQPHDYGGVDLISELLGRRLTGAGKEGAFSEQAGGSTPSVNDTIFAILALSPIQEATVQHAVREAAEWVIEVHNAKAGWPSTTVCPSHAVPASGCESDVDMTGAAIEALNAAGLHKTPVQEEAFEYLHLAQDENGGFPQYAGESEPNVASTAWAVQGMWSADENPETWVKDSSEPTDEPLGYLASMQQPDGHIRYKASEEFNGVWMTAQVAPAFAGREYPIPEVPRRVVSKPPPGGSGSGTPSSPGSDEPGGGGGSAQSGDGVIVGGGGNGAALFSRPQPQSRGRTPGGVRLLSSSHGEAKKGRRREPELNRHAAATATTKPATAPKQLTIEATPPEPSARHARKGSGSASTGSGSGGGGGQEIKGLLIDASDSTPEQSPAEPGAPGLRGASAGANQTSWLAIAIGGLIVVLILAGSLLELRRPQVVL
jgi:prenyltransferase beta subunit